MHQLEAEFEAMARELRAAFLTEIAEITGEEGN